METIIPDLPWEKLYGNVNHPYFIYTPNWIETSAGIKTLHLLCHSLNRTGFKAYLVLSESSHPGVSRINPNLLTPILTQEIADSYYLSKITPIVIYPETIPGNPLHAEFVVRYLMNFAGHLGGELEFNSSEYLIAYSKSIAQDYSGESKNIPTLFLPAIDPRDFTLNKFKENFQISYAAKYRLFNGNPPKVGELKNIEILRDGPRRQERDLVKKLISQASTAYVFENTAIIIESILSGTPVVLVKNPFFEKVIGDEELGLTFSTEKKGSVTHGLELENIDRSRSMYYEAINHYFDQLEHFVKQTQKEAALRSAKNPIYVPTFTRSPITTHRFKLAVQIYRNLGFKVLLRVCYYFVIRRISGKSQSKIEPNK